MKQFNRGGGYDRGGRGDRGFGGGGGGRGDRGFDKQMFPAVCADCGNRCEVPFKPTNNKPVLCNDCFRGSDRNDRGGRPERRNDRFSRDERPARHDRPAQNDNSREQFEQLNVKLDMVLKEIDKLKQANKIHTVESNGGLDLSEVKPAKKDKKAKKETKEETSENLPELVIEEVADEKPAKKAKKATKKAEKKPAKKAAKKAKK